MKKKILVIFGGNSNEYNISLSSASYLLENIDYNKYDVLTIGITQDNKFLLCKANHQKIREDSWQEDSQEVVISFNQQPGFYYENNSVTTKLDTDLIYVLLHGRNGEDGSIQGMIQLLDIPYVGCNILSCAIGMDKRRAQQLVSANGIKVTKSFYLNKLYKNDVESLNLEYPLYVKPINSGSSIGISRVNNYQELILGIEEAFKYDSEISIEEEICGFEVGCAIIGNKELYLGEVDQIILQEGFFDYQQKYQSSSAKIQIPALISDGLKEKIKAVATDIYRVLNCKDYARIDMFIDQNENIYFNEINNIPGFGAKGRFVSMLRASGLTTTQIIDKIIMEALNYNDRN